MVDLPELSFVRPGGVHRERDGEGEGDGDGDGDMNTRRLLLAVVLLLGGCGDVPDTARQAVTGGFRLGAVLGEQPAASGYAVADAPIAFEFPADHGAHPAFRSEWWYLTMTLQDEQGRSFGAQFTQFRQAVQPQVQAGSPTNAWDLRQIYTPRPRK